MQKHTSKLPILVDTYLSYLTAEGHGCQLKDEREKTWEEEDKRWGVSTQISTYSWEF